MQSDVSESDSVHVPSAEVTDNSAPFAEMLEQGAHGDLEIYGVYQ
jgi:hypothetical protein